MSTRSQERGRLLRRSYIGATILVVLALLFVLTGHWILAIVFGIPAVIGVWAVLQLRSVR
jgi:hypothetical protein